MTLAELRRLLHDVQNLRIGVVGDFCLDAYLMLDARASEISLETGLPTRPVRAHRYAPGGAGNVAANLRALGAAEVHAFGVVGDDPFGKEMRAIFEGLGISSGGLLLQVSGWQTHVFMKPHENEREQQRIDFGNFNTLQPATASALLRSLEDTLPRLHGVVINQQTLQGVQTPEFRASLCGLIGRHSGKLFIADSRHYSDDFTGAVRKINIHEAARLTGLRDDAAGAMDTGGVRRIAERLHARWGRDLFISRGEHGCVVCSGEGFQEVAALPQNGPIDPVGAGDSLLAGIAAALAAGAKPLAAARLGTLAAGITLRKLFETGTASPREILALAGSLPPSF